RSRLEESLPTEAQRRAAERLRLIDRCSAMTRRRPAFVPSQIPCLASIEGCGCGNFPRGDREATRRGNSRRKAIDENGSNLACGQMDGNSFAGWRVCDASNDGAGASGTAGANAAGRLASCRRDCAASSTEAAGAAAHIDLWGLETE